MEKRAVFPREGNVYFSVIKNSRNASYGYFAVSALNENRRRVGKLRLREFGCVFRGFRRSCGPFRRQIDWLRAYGRLSRGNRFEFFHEPASGDFPNSRGGEPFVIGGEFGSSNRAVLRISRKRVFVEACGGDSDACGFPNGNLRALSGRGKRSVGSVSGRLHDGRAHGVSAGTHCGGGIRGYGGDARSGSGGRRRGVDGGHGGSGFRSGSETLRSGDAYCDLSKETRNEFRLFFGRQTLELNPFFFPIIRRAS